MGASCSATPTTRFAPRVCARTIDPNIYAVGDVAELDGRTWGLWPIAVGHTQVAAVNIAGGDRSNSTETPTMTLKGVGLDVVSFGSVDASDGGHEFASRGDGHTYGKLVVCDGVIVGGLFLGFVDAQAAEDARASARIFGC